MIFGDAARPDMLERLALGRAAALVLTMDDPVEQARLTIVARARDAAHAAELYRAGATDAVPEQLESALQLPRRCWSISASQWGR